MDLDDEGEIVACTSDIPAKVFVGSGATAFHRVDASRMEGWAVDLCILRPGLAVMTDPLGFVYSVNWRVDKNSKMKDAGDRVEAKF